jgi:hypothetical protein
MITRIYPHNIENFTEIGKSILDTLFNLKSLRAIGVKYLRLNARMNKSQLIPLIWEYFKTRIYYHPNEEEPLPEALIDRTPSPLLMRYDNVQMMSGMLSYYRHDEDFMRSNFLRNMIPIMARNLEEQVVEEEEEEPDLIQSYLGESEPVVKRYNIIPTFVFKDNAEGPEEMDCPICYESIKCVDLIKLNCSHQFCGLCLKGILERHDNPTCALCRAYMCKFDIQNPEVYHLVAKYCIPIN